MWGEKYDDLDHGRKNIKDHCPGQRRGRKLNGDERKKHCKGSSNLWDQRRSNQWGEIKTTALR